MIGVTGISLELPVEFPLAKAENSGNLIHGTAPRRLFSGTYFSASRAWPGYEDGLDFRGFVNTTASHLIVTQANLIRLGDRSESMRQRYVRFQKSLSGFNKPPVLFGLGAQKFSLNGGVAADSIPPEGVEMMRFLSGATPRIGVRGAFTAEVFARVAGVSNTFVTGCPSFFSVPSAFTKLRANLKNLSPKVRLAYSATHLQRNYEREILAKVIRWRAYYIEPSNPQIHRYHLAVLDGEHPTVPDVLLPLMEETYQGGVSFSRADLEGFFGSRYRLFRNVEPWFHFNQESVDFTFGPRFHVNMASLLSGVPALWLVHDMRTKELVESLHLPHVDAAAASEMEIGDLIKLANYDDMFDNLHHLFDRFNEYLETFQLPAIPLNF
jgi:hypothetical protein